MNRTMRVVTQILLVASTLNLTGCRQGVGAQITPNPNGLTLSLITPQIPFLNGPGAPGNTGGNPGSPSTTTPGNTALPGSVAANLSPNTQPPAGSTAPTSTQPPAGTTASTSTQGVPTGAQVTSGAPAPQGS